VDDGVVCRSYRFRLTRAGAVDKTFVFINDVEIQPTRSVRSKTGMVGEDVYCLTPSEWKNAFIVTLYRSNSGKKDIVMHNIPDPRVTQLIVKKWSIETSDPEEVRRELVRLLKAVYEEKRRGGSLVGKP
jgi:hypothetical protein